jgi:hypothetical protein
MSAPDPDISAKDFWLAVCRAWWVLSAEELKYSPTPLLAAIVKAHLDLICAMPPRSE